MKYTGKNGNGKHSNLFHEYPCSTRWQYDCFNLNDLAVNSDMWQDKKQGSRLFVKDIYISKEVMVDDVWIGRSPASGELICGNFKSVRDDPYWTFRKNS